MDYAVCFVLENRACATRYTSVDSLKKTMEKAWADITIEQVASILENFPRDLRPVFLPKVAISKLFF